MQSFEHSKFYSFRVDANALGGFLEEPHRKIIPAVAPVSLPAVGGFATARSAAFNHHEIVSCSAAYTRVSGAEHHPDGSISILATAVVEGLNLLEVVTAERIVAQVSISIPNGRGAPQISLAGTRFEGLRLAGCVSDPVLNPMLVPCGDQGDHAVPLTWEAIQGVGRSQTKALAERFKSHPDKEAVKWAQRRQDWMAADQLPENGGRLLCSVVDGFGDEDSCGHIVDIPGFGRIFFGELRVSYESVQLVAVRAELGCPVKGKISIGAVGGGGSGDKS